MNPLVRPDIQSPERRRYAPVSGLEHKIPSGYGEANGSCPEGAIFSSLGTARSAPPQAPLLALLLLALFLAVFLVACGAPNNAPDFALKVGIEDMPKTLDPRYASDVYGQRITRHLIFDSLVQHGYDMEIVPRLAERWETPDDRTWIFHLRRDVRFHDGVPFTAKDVVFTFEHLLDPATASPFRATLVDTLEGVEALDDHTVRFTLPAPAASFLTKIFIPILPAHAVQAGTFGPDSADTLIGTGPYRLYDHSWVGVSLASHDEYFLGAPKTPMIVFEAVKDENTRLLKLRKGELDLLINAFPVRALEAFEKPPLSNDYRLIEEPGISYNYLAFNLSDPKLQSRELRQAMAHALDVPSIITHRLQGHATPAAGLLSPANPFHEGDVPTYPHDPDRARELLDAAGLPDPDGDGPLPRLTLELKVSNNPQAVDNARVVQAQMREVGIELELRSFEWGTFYGDIQAGNFQLTLMRWVGVSDPDFYYDVFHSSQAPPGGRNRGRFNDPRIDRLVEEGRVTLDLERRRAIYSEVQKIVAEELPYISLWHPNNVTVIHRRVEGYRQHPKAGFFSLREVELPSPLPTDG